MSARAVVLPAVDGMPTCCISLLERWSAEPGERAEVGVLSWTEELRRVAVAVSKKDRSPAASRQQLFYLLQWTSDDARWFRGHGHTRAAIRKAPRRLWNIDRALNKSAALRQR
jgi:hypothetical protein